MSVWGPRQRIMLARSGLQPLRMATLDPIQHARAPRPQQWHIIREKCQAERKHPDAEYRQQRQNASDDQQQSGWNSEPAPGWLTQAPHDVTNTLRQPLGQRVQAPIIAGISAYPSLRLCRRSFCGRSTGVRLRHVLIAKTAHQQRKPAAGLCGHLSR